MALHSRPNGSTYFTDHPSLAPAVGAALDAEFNSSSSTMNSLDDANIDGTPAIQGSKVDLGGVGYLSSTGGTLSGIISHAFEGVWQRMRDTGNGKIRYYNTDAGVIWGVCYNTEYDAGWNGRDVTDICWRLEMQSDGLHVYNAVSAASGVSPVWDEIFHASLTGITTASLMNGSITPAKLSYQTAGDYLLHSNNAVRTTTNASYVKLKESKIAKGGTYRIKFVLSNSGGSPLNPVYGRIYRNGVAVGTEQVTSSPHDNEYTFSQDISGWSSGDLIQVFGKNPSGGTNECEIKSLSVYGASPGDFGTNPSY